MTAEKRLTATELVGEIRKSLAVTTGWIPTLSGPGGPIGLTKDAPLHEVARSLEEFANAPTMPSAVVYQLRRAAESMAEAVFADASEAYGPLGVAYAYVLQAHRAANDTAS